MLSPIARVQFALLAVPMGFAVGGETYAGSISRLTAEARARG